jgi:signal peptidase II
MKLVRYSAIIFIVVIIDRLTKIITVEYLKPVGDLPLIPDILHLTYAENTGAAFGMMKDHRYIFMAASGIAIIGIYIYLVLYSAKIRPLLGISLSFIAGGGTGNMIDRIFSGYVVDFINFELIDFAIFNGADSFITVGAGLMILYILIYETKSEPKKGSRNAESKT